MYVAGDPSIGLVFLTCLGGALSAGGAGAINHAIDRDIDRQMARTAEPAGRLRADLAGRRDRLRDAARLRLLRPPGADRQPAGGGALAERPLRLRLRLHALAEAGDAAEHRDRGRRRGGAPAGRLGGGHRRAQRHRLLPLRDRLLLDPAPLLGALAADEGRVREGRRADAARRPRRAGDATPDPPLHGPPLRGHPAALLRGRLRRRVPGRLDDARRAASSTARCGCCAAPTAAGPCAPTSSRSPTWRCSSSPCPSTGCSDERLPGRSSGRNPPVDRERARSNIAAGLLAGAIAAGVFALAFVVAVLYIAS